MNAAATGPGDGTNVDVLAAEQRLHDLDDAPLEDHVTIFDDVQRRLHEGLAALDDQP